MNRVKLLYLIVFTCLLISSVSCSPEIPPIIGGKLNHDELIDGVYEGSYKGGPVEAMVKVTIQNQKISNIEIVKHSAWKGRKAVPTVPNRIIEEQSTKVDAVTGATVSSHVIMNAVQNAIEKSMKQK